MAIYRLEAKSRTTSCIEHSALKQVNVVAPGHAKQHRYLVCMLHEAFESAVHESSFDALHGLVFGHVITGDASA
jgi:hypothetical protein